MDTRQENRPEVPPPSFDDKPRTIESERTTENEGDKASVLEFKGTSPPAGTIAPGQAHITGLKTFFSACTPEAVTTLESQVNNWLKSNPNIHVHSADVTSAQMELNNSTRCTLIISVWY